MAAWHSRSKRGSAPATRSKARRPRLQRVARRQWAARRRRQPPWPRPPLSAPSAPSAPRGPPCCPLPDLAAAPAA
eukprot:scaffold110270_cov62-Phaeocystis_antarctica.AAC.4